MTDPVNAPTSIEQATALADRFAQLSGELETIVANRDAAIAATHATADILVSPILAEQTAITDALRAWWPGVAEQLTGGKRQSVELGGCMIGMNAGRVSLAMRGTEEKLLAKLKGARWAKPLIRVKESIDKVAVRKALEGKRAPELKQFGFRLVPGAETFYVKRVEQDGTIA
ncbi:MAG: host-nuclease inhibitor Gam family protein [Sphingomonas sp.]